MSEKVLVKAIKENIRSQNTDWTFIMGREVLTRDVMLRRIDNDKKFRKRIVELVTRLSVDILVRKGG